VAAISDMTAPAAALSLARVLVLVRHGQTPANAQGLLLGRSDPPLTDMGRSQARALAGLLAPDRLISSPLRRARETAAAFGCPFEVDERWIELDYGAVEGLEPHTVAADVWERWRNDPQFAPPGGESLAALGLRVRAACDELAAEAATADVVVVTHVSPIKAAVAWALGAGDELAWRLFVGDASVCRILTDGPNPRLVAFNETAPAR
jgi:broad specificity phosphatase PhoE